jgi:cytochrome c5
MPSSKRPTNPSSAAKLSKHVQPEFELGTSADTSPQLKLLGQGGSTAVLSKAQKRFNQLVKKIKATRADIERITAADQELRQLGQELIITAETERVHIEHKMVLAMDASPHRSKLSKTQQRKFRRVMEFEISELLGMTVLAQDAELKRLFGIYSKSGQSFEEMKEEEAAIEREIVASMFGMLGLDVDAEDLADPEKIAALMASKEEELRAELESDAAPRPTRKRSKAQANAEAKRQAAEAAVKKTTRQIYLSLVKHCHPDREQDEAKRVEKTEWMQKVAAAYEADDHLRLLELQMALLEDSQNAFAEFADTELKYFNDSLAQQLDELETQLMMAHPQHSGNMFGRLYHSHRSTMLHNVQVERHRLTCLIQRAAQDAQLITSEQGFKQFVNEYPLPTPTRERHGEIDLATFFR